MHATKFIFCLFVLFSAKIINAQSSIGVDLQINRDFYVLKDEGAEMKTSPRINFSPAFVYRYGFGNKIAFSTGLRFKIYPAGITFKKFIGTFSDLGGLGIQIPLQLEKNINLYHEKLFISPSLGLNYNLIYNEVSGLSGSMSTLNDSIRYTSTSKGGTNSFLTAMAGLSLEFRFKPSTSIALYCQYTRGFSTISSQTITYQVNQGPENNAEQKTSGTYFTYLGVKIYHHFPGKVKLDQSKKD